MANTSIEFYYSPITIIIIFLTKTANAKGTNEYKNISIKLI